MINNEEMVKVETTRGPKMVPKKFVNIAQNSQAAVSIKTKDGTSIPLLLKSLPVVFKNTINSAGDKKKITIQKLPNMQFDRKILTLDKTKTKKDQHICEQCGKRFPNETKYKNHLRFHSNECRTCNICNKVFKHPSTLQKHMHIHMGLKFTCKLCNASVATKTVLDAHIRRHKGQYTHKCDDCGKEYYNTKSYNHHMEAEHVGIRYPCEICGSVLKSKRYYKDHMANHSNKDPKTFKCNVCHKYYSTKSALNGHMRIHNGQRYVCHICGKKSIQKGAHNGHMRMHTGEKSYICELCGKDFLRKDVLDQHMRRIHEISKIPCTKCNQIFYTEHQLMVHLHTHPEVTKPYPCELCEEKFIDKNFLRNHVNRVHIENKLEKKPNPRYVKKEDKLNVSFLCTVCKEGFDNTIEFREHLSTHQDYLTYDGLVESAEFNELIESEETPYANHEVVVEELINF